MNQERMDSEQRLEEAREWEERFHNLPLKARCAVMWVVEHFDFVKSACRESELTPEELEKYMGEAIANQDHLMVALLLLCQKLGGEGAGEGA